MDEENEENNNNRDCTDWLSLSRSKHTQFDFSSFAALHAERTQCTYSPHTTCVTCTSTHHITIIYFCLHIGRTYHHLLLLLYALVAVLEKMELHEMRQVNFSFHNHSCVAASLVAVQMSRLSLLTILGKLEHIPNYINPLHQRIELHSADFQLCLRQNCTILCAAKAICGFEEFSWFSQKICFSVLCVYVGGNGGTGNNDANGNLIS